MTREGTPQAAALTEDEFRTGVRSDGTRLMQPAVVIDHRASIASWVEAEGEKRGRHFARAGRMVADAIRAGFDLPDEPAPDGVRAQYNDAASQGGAA